MYFNSSEFDDIRKKILIAKGIEQAWFRRFSQHIYSGVRVKVQRKMLSLCDQINCRKSMIKENEQKSLESTNNSSKNQSFISYQTKSIDSNNSHETNYLLKMQQNYQNMNSIGIQTRIIIQTDQQTSCNLIKSTNRKDRFSTSYSETSISEESSTQTSSISDTSKHHVRNRNRNNSAIDVDIEQNNNHTNLNGFKIRKINKQISNNKQPLQNVNNNTQCYVQSPLPSSRKKRFFQIFRNLIPFHRLSSLIGDRTSMSTTIIRTPIIINTDENLRSKNRRLLTSRCRRSVDRNFNHNALVEPEKQRTFIRSMSNLLVSTRQQCKQTHSNLLNKKTPLHRKKYTNQRHRRKYCQTLKGSSDSQWSSKLETSVPIILDKFLDDQSKVLLEECIGSSTHHMKN